MHKKRLTYSGYLMLLLFGLPPFILSATDHAEGIPEMNTLPAIVPVITGNIRWVIFFLVVVFFLFLFKRKFSKIHHSYLLIVVFYAFQMLYAFGTSSDIFRYVGLTIMSTTIPFFVATTVREHGLNVFAYINNVIYV